jgi:predicted secreted protein
MSNEIIVVKQLPVIEQQLAQIKETVNERVSAAMKLVCTEDTVKAVKKARTELNAEFKAWEDKRKEVKTAVMTPYEKFEAVYKDCISDSYKAADKDLKQKIDEVEQELKSKKAAEVKSYFEEYLSSKDIDFVTYEQAGINVTLSASLKSLKEQAKAFIDRIVSDLALIETFTDLKAEILVEYKKSLNVSDAITGVKARAKAVQEEQARQEAEAEKRAAEAQRVEAIKAAIPEAPAAVEAPTEQTAAPAPEQKFCIRFTVKGTREQLIALKKFLNEGGYIYE